VDDCVMAGKEGQRIERMKTYPADVPYGTTPTREHPRDGGKAQYFKSAYNARLHRIKPQPGW